MVEPFSHPWPHSLYIFNSPSPFRHSLYWESRESKKHGICLLYIQVRLLLVQLSCGIKTDETEKLLITVPDDSSDFLSTRFFWLLM